MRTCRLARYALRCWDGVNCQGDSWMDEIIKQFRRISRRQLLTRTSLGLGAVALSSLINPALLAAANSATTSPAGAGPGGAFKAPHFAPKAKRVIYLFQSGG